MRVRYKRETRKFSHTAAALFAVFVTAAGAFSQAETLRGRVADEQGGGVTQALVRLRAAGISFERTVVTDEKGEFSFSGLSGGVFDVSVRAKGFASVERSISTAESAEIVLKPEGIAEVVSVSSSYLAGTSGALEQTAGSIQIIDRFQLEQSRVTNFSELLRKVTGVSVRDEEGLGLRPNIGIRGTNPTRSTKVLLLEDGVPLSYAPYGDNASYYHPPVERFESVEVQKGSGQIAYGPVTVAGLVNYVTPNPPESTAFSLKIVGGNRDALNGNVSFGGTYGKTGLLVNLNRRQGEGARDNVRSGLTDFSSKVVQTLNDRNILTAKFSLFKERSQTTYSGLTEAEYAIAPRSNPFLNDRFDGWRSGFSLQHTSVISDKANLVTNFYTNYFSRDWWRQSSNSSQRPNRLNADSDCLSLADLYTKCGSEGRLRDYRTVGIEPRLNLRFDTGSVRSDFNAGFRFHYESQERLQRNTDSPLSRDGVLSENNSRRNSASSAFVQNKFIYKKLAVSAGVRVEKIGFERTNQLTNAFGKTTITEVIPGVGFSFNALANTTVFAGVHRGFAPPRTEDIISNSGGVVELEAEKSWNYEAGIRTRPVIGVTVESTFFRTSYENQIVAASVAGGVGAAFTNGGETRHQGIELNARIDTSDLLKTNYNVYLQANYTGLLEAEFSGIRTSSVSGFGNVSVSGNRLPYAARNFLNFSVGYAHRNIDFFVENNYIGEQFSDDLNSIASTANGQRGLIGRQIYWNGTINYRLEKFRSVLFVTAKNIFDKTYIVDRSRGILPSSPRLIQAGWKFSF